MLNIKPILNIPSNYRSKYDKSKTFEKLSFSGIAQELAQLNGRLKIEYGHLKNKNVLILFSGGYDTSFMAKFFQSEIGAKVHTLAFDLSDKRQPINKIEEQAKKIGVTKHITFNATNEFVKDYVLPSIYANAKYNGRHPLSSSLSRPLMMKKTIEMAKEYNCPVVIQGTSPWQNNAPRFQKAFVHFNNNSDLKMELPILKLNVPRKLEQEYLTQKGIKISGRENDMFSADGNIWNWEAEDGKIRTMPYYRPKLQTNRIFNIPENAPNKAEFIDIEFKKGKPIKINGKNMSLKKIIGELNTIGGKHGIGIYDTLESRPLGFKEREIHVAPAADIIITAHSDLEQATLAQDTLMLKHYLDTNWTNFVCNGDWFRQSVKMISAAIKEAQEKVTGLVKLKLFKGHIDVIGRTSPHSLDAQTIKIENEIIPSMEGFNESSYLSRKGY